MRGASATGTVTITLGAVNDALLARNDGFSGRHGQPVTGNVLANNGSGADSDAEGDTLTVIAAELTTAQGGHVTLNADGTFTYQPSPAFVGHDSFSYLVGDGNGHSATATVALDITNAAPVANTDWFTAAFGNGVSDNVLANNGTGADSDADGDVVSATAGEWTTARGGSATLQADGRFVFTPAEAFYDTDSFLYTISDGFGGTATNTVLINTAAPAGSIYGTSQDDVRGGTALADAMFGLGGEDVLSGLDGHDIVAGGDGKDRVYGDAGNDKLNGQADRDTLRGGLGAETLSGGADSDALFGDENADKLTGGTGIDTLAGGTGNDWFIFDTANGSSHDRVADFSHGDKLTVFGCVRTGRRGTGRLQLFCPGGGSGNRAWPLFLYRLDPQPGLGCRRRQRNREYGDRDFRHQGDPRHCRFSGALKRPRAAPGPVRFLRTGCCGQAAGLVASGRGI